MKVVTVLIGFVGIILASICGYIIFKLFIHWYKKRKLASAGINSPSDITENYFTWLMRNGVSILKRPCAYLLSHINFINNNFQNLTLLLNDRNIKSDVVSVTSSFVALLLLCGIIISLFFGSIIAGVATILCLYVLLSTLTKAYLDKRVTNLRNSIPDTLRSMSTCFSAGYTIFQTFSHLSHEGKGLIKSLFTKCTNILQTGGTVSSSLNHLKNVKEVPELTFLAVALDVQHQTGGSIKPVIESAKDMVENKLELMRMLQVQTAQAKLSARIVMILPFALIAIFSIISPGFLTPFFTSFFGILLLLIACLMQAAGFILVKKMLNVEI